MKVIESANVDLISPFPLKEVQRVWGWMKAGSTFNIALGGQAGPTGPTELAAYLEKVLPSVESWGIIDKFNVLGMRHEAPLVGLITFSPETAFNGYLEAAATRKAQNGILTEALQTASREVFSDWPGLTRLTLVMPYRKVFAGKDGDGHPLLEDDPLREVVKAAGFVQEGLKRDWFVVEGKPRAVAEFGLLRKRFLVNEE